MGLLTASTGRKKVVAVPEGLDEHEGTIQDQRGGAGEDELRCAERGTGSRGRIIRNDERERGECGQHRQRRAGALQLEVLLVMAGAADQQAKPDDSVANQHDRRKDRVARKSSFVVRMGDHDGNDQRHLDDGDRDRQDQCAERLADAMRHDLGMVDGGKNSGDQDNARGRQHHAATANDDRSAEDHPRQQRPGPAPPGY